MQKSDNVVSLAPEQKYHKDGPFMEPVVICDSCTKVCLVVDLQKIGKCPNCGNTRVRNVQVLNDENREQVEKWVDEGRCDPDWLKLFEVA